MEYTLEKFIDILEPHIPLTLVNSVYLENIRKIAQTLPSLSFGCFECFFGNDESRVDLNIGISGNLNEPAFFYKWMLHNTAIADNKLQYNLNSVAKFCNKWSDPGCSLRLLLDDYWLIYDITDPPGQSVIPWHEIRFTTVPFNRDPVFKEELIFQTLSMMDEMIVPEWTEKMRQFFLNLSPAILVSAVGIPFSRGISSLRIYLVLYQYEDILTFLCDNGWPGDITELQRSTVEFAEGCSIFGLTIDMNPGIKHTIGIEFWYDDNGHEKKLGTAMDKLIEKKLCTAEQKEAYLSWPGEFEINNNAQAWSWPDSLLTPAKEVEKIIIRKKSPYIKIVYHPGEKIKAKGYMYFDRLVFTTAMQVK